MAPIICEIQMELHSGKMENFEQKYAYLMT